MHVWQDILKATNKLINLEEEDVDACAFGRDESIEVALKLVKAALDLT